MLQNGIIIIIIILCVWPQAQESEIFLQIFPSTEWNEMYYYTIENGTKFNVQRAHFKLIKAENYFWFLFFL